MAAVHPSHSSWRTAARSRAFIVHYLQMLAAMGLGMAAFMPLTMTVGDAIPAELNALLMATSMTAGMTAWMAFRRHPWRMTVEMGAAMYLAFVVLFPPLWIGVLSEQAVLVAGHALMLPAMGLAMLRHPEHYLGSH